MAGSQGTADSQLYKLLKLPRLGLGFEIGRIYHAEDLRALCKGWPDYLEQLETLLKNECIFQPYTQADLVDTRQPSLASSVCDKVVRGRMTLLEEDADKGNDAWAVAETIDGASSILVPKPMSVLPDGIVSVGRQPDDSTPMPVCRNHPDCQFVQWYGRVLEPLALRLSWGLDTPASLHNGLSCDSRMRTGAPAGGEAHSRSSIDACNSTIRSNESPVHPIHAQSSPPSTRTFIPRRFPGLPLTEVAGMSENTKMKDNEVGSPASLCICFEQPCLNCSVVAPSPPGHACSPLSGEEAAAKDPYTLNDVEVLDPDDEMPRAIDTAAASPTAQQLVPAQSEGQWSSEVHQPLKTSNAGKAAVDITDCAESPCAALEYWAPLAERALGDMLEVLAARAPASPSMSSSAHCNGSQTPVPSNLDDSVELQQHAANTPRLQGQQQIASIMRPQICPKLLDFGEAIPETECSSDFLSAVNPPSPLRPCPGTPRPQFQHTSNCSPCAPSWSCLDPIATQLQPLQSQATGSHQRQGIAIARPDARSVFQDVASISTSGKRAAATSISDEPPRKVKRAAAAQVAQAVQASSLHASSSWSSPVRRRLAKWMAREDMVVGGDMLTELACEEDLGQAVQGDYLLQDSAQHQQAPSLQEDDLQALPHSAELQVLKARMNVEAAQALRARFLHSSRKCREMLAQFTPEQEAGRVVQGRSMLQGSVQQQASSLQQDDLQSSPRSAALKAQIQQIQAQLALRRGDEISKAPAAAAVGTPPAVLRKTPAATFTPSAAAGNQTSGKRELAGATFSPASMAACEVATTPHVRAALRAEEDFKGSVKQRRDLLPLLRVARPWLSSSSDSTELKRRRLASMAGILYGSDGQHEDAKSLLSKLRMRRVLVAQSLPSWVVPIGRNLTLTR